MSRITSSDVVGVFLSIVAAQASVTVLWEQSRTAKFARMNWARLAR